MDHTQQYNFLLELRKVHIYHQSFELNGRIYSIKENYSYWSIYFYDRYVCSCFNDLSYLPTPPFGQDMTQGQFLSGV